MGNVVKEAISYMPGLSIVCFKEIHFATVVTAGCSLCTATSFNVKTADEYEAAGVDVCCHSSWRNGSQ